MPQPIHIDLRRDLPKVREQLEAILPNRRECRYSAPCVVGAMMTPKVRRSLACNPHDVADIAMLIAEGVVRVPPGQEGDIDLLQEAFDNCRKETFLATLARLEAKYLTGEVA